MIEQTVFTWGRTGRWELRFCDDNDWGEGAISCNPNKQAGQTTAGRSDYVKHSDAQLPV